MSISVYLPPGSKLEQCPACGLVFSNTTAGDAHRVGAHGVTDGPDRRRCLTREEMRAKTIESGKNEGEPWYATRVDRWGNEVWSRNAPGSSERLRSLAARSGRATTTTDVASGEPDAGDAQALSSTRVVTFA